MPDHDSTTRTGAPRQRAPGAGRPGDRPAQPTLLNVEVELAQKEALKALPGGLAVNVRAAIRAYLKRHAR